MATRNILWCAGFVTWECTQGLLWKVWVGKERLSRKQWKEDWKTILFIALCLLLAPIGIPVLTWICRIGARDAYYKAIERELRSAERPRTGW